MANGKYEKWIQPEGLLLLEAWARDGLTDAQIAHNCGCGVRTLYDWKERFPQISQSLKRGKEIVDIQVENALLRRALGYRYKEITREPKTDPATGFSCLVTTKEVTKEVAPDTTAQIYWLKNRRPKQWREKPAASCGDAADNNLVQAIAESAEEDMDTDDLPEIQ